MKWAKHAPSPRTPPTHPHVPFNAPHLIALIAALVCLLSVPPADGQTGALHKDPAKLVRKYLELDIKGARLSALTWEAQKPYIAWTEEPTWGQIVVVNGYTIAATVEEWQVINNVEVVIPVDFTILGSVYLNRAVFFPDPHTERVGFHVKAVDGLWRLVEPMLPPHVGKKRVLNYVRQSILEETNTDRLAALSTLRDELQRAMASSR